VETAEMSAGNDSMARRESAKFRAFLLSIRILA
jgi:hypothetical protein